MSQEVKGEEHLVLHLSRKLISAENNYTAIEREALVIKWAFLLPGRAALHLDH